MIKKSFLMCFLLATLGLTTACAQYRYDVPPPPPPRAGIVGYAPGPGYVWCDGYWDLRGGRWFWVNGFWNRPPHQRAVWVPSYWERHGRDYRFHRGRWRY
jgi:hypothetical protein